MARAVIFTVICLYFLSPVNVDGYYCDSDKCDGEDEYCCGANICCASYAVWQMWYFWCGIVFFVIMLSACAGFCRYRYYERTVIIQGTGPYSRLGDTSDTHSYTQQGHLVYTDYKNSYSHDPQEGQYSQDYPPPSYSQVLGHKEKDPNFMR